MTITDAYILAECDHCGNCEEVYLNATARGNYSTDNVEGKLKDLGWIMPHGIDGATYCTPDCAQKEEAKCHRSDGEEVEPKDMGFCERCDAVLPTEDLQRVNGEYLCLPCADATKGSWDL